MVSTQATGLELSPPDEDVHPDRQSKDIVMNDEFEYPIEPNVPPKCKFLGLPAKYMRIYTGQYTICVLTRDIPEAGHSLSNARIFLESRGEGELNVTVGSLDIEDITDVEPEV
jgi:hypothetical protein